MRLHANAALSLKQREKMVLMVLAEHRPVSEAARAFRVSEPTVRKWTRRYELEGSAGLLDRPSTPKISPNRTPARRVEAICALRRLRFSGSEIAELLEMSDSTVSAVLTREGLAGSGGWGLSLLSVTSASAPVSSSTSTSRNSGGSSAAPASAFATESARTTTDVHRPRRPAPPHGRLGLRPRRHR